MLLSKAVLPCRFLIFFFFFFLVLFSLPSILFCLEKMTGFCYTLTYTFTAELVLTQLSTILIKENNESL